MASYKRAMARLGILALMIAGGALLGNKPAQATDCLATCTSQRNICTESCGDFLTCVDACWNVWAACVKNCG